MSQLCIHTQLPSNFCTFKYWKKSIQYTSKCTGIWIKTQPWLKHHIHDENHPKGTHYARYNSCTGSHTILSISIGMSWMIEPLFESIRSDDSIHPWLADKSCDQLAFHECLGFTERYQHHWFLRVVRNGLTQP